MIKNEEEFNNFMHKVTEVHSIVKKLSSNNSELNQIGIQEANKYLGDTNDKICETINDENIEVKITSNKTVINKIKDEPKNEGEMSADAFMREVEIDAKKRSEDKKIRKERSDTLKIQGNKAFRRQEYEKALASYNKAIELIKDSCILYTNRALTYINLKLYDKAIQDCQTALKLNENSLKAWLYLTVCYSEIEDINESQKCIQEAKNRHPNNLDVINEFLQKCNK